MGRKGDKTRQIGHIVSLIGGATSKSGDTSQGAESSSEESKQASENISNKEITLAQVVAKTTEKITENLPLKAPATENPIESYKYEDNK